MGNVPYLLCVSSWFYYNLIEHFHLSIYMSILMTICVYCTSLCSAFVFVILILNLISKPKKALFVSVVDNLHEVTCLECVLGLCAWVLHGTDWLSHFQFLFCSPVMLDATAACWEDLRLRGTGQSNSIWSGSYSLTFLLLSVCLFLSCLSSRVDSRPCISLPTMGTSTWPRCCWTEEQQSTSQRG